MVTQMADDPAIMESMIAQNPQLQAAMQVRVCDKNSELTFLRKTPNGLYIQKYALNTD